MTKRWQTCAVLAALSSSCGSDAQPDKGISQPGTAASGVLSAGAQSVAGRSSGAGSSAGASAATAGTGAGPGVGGLAVAGSRGPSSSGGTSASAAAAGATASGSGAAGTAAPAAVAGNTAAGGTSGSSAPELGGAGGETIPPAQKPRRAVSADFLNHTLSIVDVDKLTEGATRDDALIGTVDLSKYVPGPLAVAVAPDGKTALVSISGGWLRLVASGIPAGNGMLVFVDLDSRQVLGELDIGVDPMGIAIAKDGKHAFVGLMSETYMAYVDIEKRSFEKIPTGNSWNEELAIDDTGTLGVLTAGTAGNAVSFAVDMPAMKNGQTVGLTGDAGGVAFFPGTKLAYVVQAPTALTGKTGGYNVLDLSDPTAPKVTDSKRTSGDTGQAYPVTAVPNRKSVVYPSADENTKKLTLTEVTLEGDKAKVVQTIAVGDATFSYGLSSSAEGLVLAAVGVEHYIAVVDLNTGKVFTVPWGVTQNGPLDIKYIP